MARSRNYTFSEKRNGAGPEWAAVISLVILGLVYYLPMFAMEGIVSSDDTTFHIGRLVGLSNVWSSPVNFNSFGGNGLMVNIFYPWLTMYPMQLLYRLSGSYVTAYKLYYTLLTVATLLVAYCSMKRIAGNRAGAYAFAVLYTYSSYRYADIFNRGSLGEAIALTFLPLVLLGIYRVCSDEYDRWPSLAAGMTLIAYSHVLTLLMSAAFVGIIYIATLAFQDERKKRFMALVKAAVLSIGLSAAMMVPMLEQYMKNELFTPGGSGDKMASSAYSPAEIIRFTLVNNPEGRGIGILGAAAALAACVLLVIRAFGAGRSERSGRRLSFSLILMIAGALLFVCTSDILPWHYLGESTPVSTIQFAWRLNAYPVLSFTAAFAVLISEACEGSRRVSAAVLAIVIVAAAGLHGFNLFTHNGIYVDKDPITEADIAKWPSGNVDYAPLRASEYKEARGKSMEYMYIDGEETEKSPRTEDSGTRYIQTAVTLEDGAALDIPVFRYYGERVLLNGEEAAAEMSERGTTQLTLPKAGTYTVEISYKYTVAARAAWLFSIIVLIYGTILVARKSRR